MGWRKANLLRADEEVDSPDRVGIFDRQLKVERKKRICSSPPILFRGLAFYVFFDCGDFVEAALVAAAEVGGGEESSDHFDGGFRGDDAAAEGEDVGVIVFAGEAGGCHVMGEGGANAGNFVGGDGDADARAANGDAEIGLF